MRCDARIRASLVRTKAGPRKGLAKGSQSLSPRNIQILQLATCIPIRQLPRLFEYS